MTRLQLPPSRTLPPARAAAMRHLVQAEVTGTSRRRPLLFAGGAVVLAAGATAAGFAFVPHSQPVTDQNTARCYAVASLSAGDESFTTVAMSTPAGAASPAQVADPLGICSDLWRQGVLRPGPDGARGAPDPEASYSVPPLVTCVLADGTAAVFPGSKSTCAALGLPSQKT